MMRRTDRRARRLLVAAIALALLGASCGTEGSDEASTGTTGRTGTTLRATGTTARAADTTSTSTSTIPPTSATTELPPTTPAPTTTAAPPPPPPPTLPPTTSAPPPAVVTPRPTAAPAPAPAPSATPSDPMARDLLDRVNAERAARGLALVTWDPTLASGAQSWAANLAQQGGLNHADLNALLSSPPLAGAYTGLGENVFMASGPVPAGALHVAWMQSDGHRKNILQPGFDRLGIGVVCTPSGQVFATQRFGRSAGSSLPPITDGIPAAQPIARPAQDGATC